MSSTSIYPSDKINVFLSFLHLDLHDFILVLRKILPESKLVATIRQQMFFHKILIIK